MATAITIKRVKKWASEAAQSTSIDENAMIYNNPVPGEGSSDLADTCLGSLNSTIKTRTGLGAQNGERYKWDGQRVKWILAVWI